MNITAVFNFLLIAGALQGFVFNIATFLSRKKLEKPILFLNLFVLFLSLNNLQSWLIDKELLPALILETQFTIPWNVLIVPMFYAFLVYYLGIEKKKWPFLVPTAIIFLLEVLARTLVISLIKNGNLPESYLQDYNALEDAISLVYATFLFIKAIRILYKWEALFPAILEYDNLKWIKNFMKLGGVVMFLWLFAVLVNIFSETFNPPYSFYPLRLGSSVLIYWVGYQAFFQYVQLKDRIVLRGKIRKVSTPWASGTSSAGPNDKKIAKETLQFRAIDQYISSNQKYLNPYLSMENIANELAISSSNLSRLVNRNAQKNFSDYINSLRVQEAKRYLARDDFASYTIVSIGLECGFNSKSTFYAAFKKFTGQTPTAYRKEAAAQGR